MDVGYGLSIAYSNQKERKKDLEDYKKIAHWRNLCERIVIVEKHNAIKKTIQFVLQKIVKRQLCADIF